MSDLDRLLDWYEALSVQSLDKIAVFYNEEARFKDPFNEVQGVPAIRAIFRHMFETTEAPRFVVIDRMQQGEQGFATWDFHFCLRGRDYVIHGASHLRFAADGRVCLHRDYWDAAEELFQKLPVVGAPVRWLRRRFSAA